MEGSNFQLKIHPADGQKFCEHFHVSFLIYEKQPNHAQPQFFGYTNLFHHYLPYSKANIDGQDPEIAEAVCVNLKQGVATLQDDMRPLTQEVI